MDLAWTSRDGTGAGRRSREAVTRGKALPTSGEVAADSGRHTGHNTQMGGVSPCSLAGWPGPMSWAGQAASASSGLGRAGTHRDTLAAAIVTPIGAALASAQAGADAQGYQALLDFAQAHAPGRRCWAVEGAGSYGAGLAVFLAGHGERMVEVCRPKRPPRAAARKSDEIDFGLRWDVST